MMFFASLKMMLLHFVSQWCDVYLKMWRSHTSSGEAVIIGEANIICRRQTSLKKAVCFRKRLFSDTPFQNRSAEQSFSKSIHVFSQRVDLSLGDDESKKLSEIFRAFAPCPQTNLCIWFQESVKASSICFFHSLLWETTIAMVLPFALTKIWFLLVFTDSIVFVGITISFVEIFILWG